MTYPSGITVQFGYTADRVTSLTAGSETILTDVLHEPFGPVRGWTWGNASLTARTYDLAGQLTQLDSGGLKSYTYDDALRIAAIADAGDPTRSWFYGYDSFDRLTSAARTGVTQGWSYDANGNRLTQTGSAASTYSVQAASNRVSGIGGALSRTYTYDAAGNTASVGENVLFDLPAARKLLGL